MAGLVVILSAVSFVALLVAGFVAYLLWKRPDPLEQLGVKDTYAGKVVWSIDAYCELKEKIYRENAKDSEPDEVWMSKLSRHAKELLKYQLLQRAIQSMSALQKIDADARGYWRLFSKGMITRSFWNSVVEAEREIAQEVEALKQEASCLEPTQDPNSIISDAMQLIMRYGDKLPSPQEMQDSSKALQGLTKHLPPGHPHNMPPGMPPNMPPGMMGPTPVGPQPQPAPQPADGDDSYNWKQDTDEVEVSVHVPGTATKKDVRVVFQSRSLRVQHCGTTLLEGQLASQCRPEGSTWTLSKGNIVVSLEKADPRPWPSLFAAKAA